MIQESRKHNPWTLIPTIMRAVSEAQFYPAHLDGTPSNALEQQGKSETVGVSVLVSKLDLRRRGLIVWQPSNEPDTPNGMWSVIYKRKRDRTKFLLLATEISLAVDEPIHLFKGQITL